MLLIDRKLKENKYCKINHILEKELINSTINLIQE